MIKDVRSHLEARGHGLPAAPMFTPAADAYLQKVSESFVALLEAYESGDPAASLQHICNLVFATLATGTAAGLDVECGWLLTVTAAQQLAKDPTAPRLPPMGWRPPDLHPLFPTVPRATA